MGNSEATKNIQADTEIDPEVDTQQAVEDDLLKEDQGEENKDDKEKINLTDHSDNSADKCIEQSDQNIDKKSEEQSENIFCEKEKETEDFSFETKEKQIHEIVEEDVNVIQDHDEIKEIIDDEKSDQSKELKSIDEKVTNEIIPSEQAHEIIPSEQEDHDPECDQSIDNQQPLKNVPLENEESYPDDLNPFGSDEETTKKSTNPFGSDSDPEEEEEEKIQLQVSRVCCKKSGLVKNYVIDKNPQFQSNYYETW